MITYRRSYIYYILMLSVFVLASCANSGKKQVDKPNLIVIMADDLGYADVGFNGCTDIPTPNIDRIAIEGVRFDAAYTTFSVCSPSRAGFITGRYPQRFGYERNVQYRTDDPNMGLAKSEMTLAESLAKVGYRSGVIGKWHLGAHISNHPLNRGFDEFFGHLGGGHRYFPEELTIQDSYMAKDERQSYNTWIMRDHGHVKIKKYLTDEFSDEALRFIDRHKDEPFFLYLSYNAPHAPLQATEKYLSRFKNIKDKKRRTYAAMVSALDDGVGAVLQKLEQLNIDENTLVFFLSDNGGPEKKNGSNNGILRAGKGSVYEGGFHVPFALRWKGHVTPGEFMQPVSSMDIFATISALSNSSTNPEKPLDGVNLIPYLNGDNKGIPHPTICLRKYDSKQFAIRHGKFKLVTRDNAKIKELYNLTEDISEEKNIANENPEKLNELDSIRLKWNSELIYPAFLGIMHSGAWGWKPKDEEIYEIK